MARIYRLTDRIEVKVKDINFKLSPLSISQKSELHAHITKGSANGDTGEILKASMKAIKFTVKDLTGVDDIDDKPYELSFDGDGCLSDECVEDLMNMEYNQNIIAMCVAMAQGTPEEFTGADGKPLEGVKRIHKAKAKGKAKKVSKSPN